jgi:hypothetical protein
MNGFNTPIALFNFNRPKLTRRVFEIVRKVKPKRLLLVADGPRTDRPNDARLCAEVRAVFDEIDWDCEVSRNFADTNMGSFKRNSSGLNWVFDTVEEAIILEDDCIPSLSFFPYCEELLERYRDDPRIGLISGNNFMQTAGEPGRDSYFFSAYALTWGWASWRSTWKQVDLSMSWWESKTGQEMLLALFPQPEEWKYWHKLYEAIHSGEMKNAWDYQLILTCFQHALLCVIPKANLISNVGFGADASNCIWEADPLANRPKGDLDLPLAHPADISRSVQVDHDIFLSRFDIPPPTAPRRKNALHRRAINFLARKLRMIVAGQKDL